MKKHQTKTLFEIVDQGVAFRKEADQVEVKGEVATKVRKPIQLRVVAQANENDQDVAEFKERLAKVRAKSADKAPKKVRKPKKKVRKPLTEKEKRAKRDEQARKPLKAKLSIDLSKVKVAS